MALNSSLGPDGWTVSIAGRWVPAPASLSSTSGGYNAAQVDVASGSTLTIAAGAAAVLGEGITLRVGQSASATLAFSGGATKQNASGISATSVTLAACGIYALIPGDAADTWRLTGGAST